MYVETDKGDDPNLVLNVDGKHEMYGVLGGQKAPMSRQVNDSRWLNVAGDRAVTGKLPLSY